MYDKLSLPQNVFLFLTVYWTYKTNKNHSNFQVPVNTYVNNFILGQLFYKSLSNTLNQRTYPSFMSTLPERQLEDKSSSIEGIFQLN